MLVKSIQSNIAQTILKKKLKLELLLNTETTRTFCFVRFRKRGQFLLKQQVASKEKKMLKCIQLYVEN
jgi:hypothetical protein